MVQETTSRTTALDRLVAAADNDAARDELNKLRSSAHEAHVAWSVTLGYFEQTQQPSVFFSSLRQVFRKESSDSQRLARLRESFMTTLANNRDFAAEALLNALIEPDRPKADALILEALDALSQLPVPGGSSQ